MAHASPFAAAYHRLHRAGWTIGDTAFARPERLRRPRAVHARLVRRRRRCAIQPTQARPTRLAGAGSGTVVAENDVTTPESMGWVAPILVIFKTPAEKFAGLSGEIGPYSPISIPDGLTRPSSTRNVSPVSVFPAPVNTTLGDGTFVTVTFRNDVFGSV